MFLKSSVQEQDKLADFPAHYPRWLAENKETSVLRSRTGTVLQSICGIKCFQSFKPVRITIEMP